jgi:hypothetical protein
MILTFKENRQYFQSFKISGDQEIKVFFLKLLNQIYKLFL